MIRSHLSITLLLVSAFLFGCKTKERMPADLEGMTMVTVVDSRGLDGCSFLLKTETDEYLEPMNLDESLRINGLKIAVRYKPSKSVSICMKGKPVEIISAKAIK